jgi:pSer/pThr/pTyr-binding forkhead associated (FHA) protein
MYGEVAYLGRRGGSKKPNPELDLTNLPYAEHISRPHACINWDPTVGRYSITDTQSANGTYLNGQLLRPGQAYPLSNGDQLDFGHQHLVKFTIAIA